jgi:CRISPR system Cascade subunit CasD
MATILLRIKAPFQSWGYQESTHIRDTNRYPTKSGIIGLCCAAIGKPREETPDFPTLVEFGVLKMGVRVLNFGSKMRDFCTVGSGINKPTLDTVFDSKCTTKRKEAIIITKYYLVGADFLVALEGDNVLLGRIKAGFLNPVFPLFFGRKNCPPACDILVGVYESGLVETLRDAVVDVDKPENLFILESNTGVLVNDVPLISREFGVRRVVECSLEELSCS